jgi:hypothetical protein
MEKSGEKRDSPMRTGRWQAPKSDGSKTLETINNLEKSNHQWVMERKSGEK